MSRVDVIFLPRNNLYSKPQNTPTGRDPRIINVILQTHMELMQEVETQPQK